jgi:hypothetical protein
MIQYNRFTGFVKYSRQKLDDKELEQIVLLSYFFKSFPAIVRFTALKVMYRIGVNDYDREG